MRRIPTLDGWRGIAILLVIVTHLPSAGLYGHTWHYYHWLDLGQHGVGIFFVLSGYLITTRLLSEQHQGLGSFYIRRFFRLMPCAWIYLAVLPAAGCCCCKTRVIGHEVCGPVLFSFIETTFPTWKIRIMLSQVISGRSRWKSSSIFFGRSCLRLRGRGGPLPLLSLVPALVLRCGSAMWDQASRNKLTTGVRIDALLIGCTLAFMLESEAGRSFILRHSGWLFYGCLPLFFWCVYRIPGDPTVSMESIAIAVMIAVTSLTPSSFVGRVLENQHLKFLGLISYSVYVWQELFLLPHWGFIGLALLIPVSIGSYRFIERPGVPSGQESAGVVRRGATRRLARLLQI